MYFNYFKKISTCFFQISIKKRVFFSNNNTNIKKIIENEIMLGNEIRIIFFSVAFGTDING